MPDHDATLQVVTNEGASNHWNVHFTADRDVRILTRDQVKVTCANGNPLSADYCDEACNVTLCVAHGLEVPGYNTGIDYVSASLKNGWTYYKHGFTWHREGLSGDASAESIGTATTPKIRVSWNVGAWSATSYRLKLKIVGPVGVPYQ